MNTWQGIAVIVGMCAVVLVIGLVRNKTEIFINFILRMVTGLAVMYVVNQIFLSQDIMVQVGVNVFSLAAAGFLGVPGVALMYGIAGCKFL